MRQVEWRHLEQLVRPSVQRSVAPEHEALHHALAGAGHGDHQSGAARVVVDPALQHGRQLRRRRHRVRQLVEHDRPAPGRRAGINGETRQQAAPVPVFDVAKAGEPDREGLRQVASLHVGGRLVGDGIDAALPPAPLHEQTRLADPAAAEHHGQAPARAVGQRPQTDQFACPVEELHYSSQHNADKHKNQPRPGAARPARMLVCPP